MLRSAACLTLSLLLSGPARAHDKWLEAEPFTSASPQQTKVYLLTGEALQQSELLPVRRAGSLRSFSLRTHAGARDLRGLLREDQQPIAVVPAGDIPPGTSVLALETAPVAILLAPEKFQRYLFEERLIDILSLRARSGQEDAPGRELYSRSIKALLQVGDKLDDAALRPLGHELEILPLAHPYGLKPGDKLAVRVVFRGKPLGGRAVTFANRYRSNVSTKITRTDGKGEAAVSVERAGEWLVALVHMEPAAAPDVDWRSHWASLSFSLADRPGS